MTQQSDSYEAVRLRMATVGYCEHGARFEDCPECRPPVPPPYQPFGPFFTPNAMTGEQR